MTLERRDVSGEQARVEEKDARSDVALVDLSRRAEVADIESVEVVVLVRAEKD